MNLGSHTAGEFIFDLSVKITFKPLDNVLTPLFVLNHNPKAEAWNTYYSHQHNHGQL